MRPVWRILIAAAAAAQAAGGAVAQDSQPAPSTNATETVGPRELRNFQLNGTVTRPAETPPASAPAPTSGSAPATTAPQTPTARAQPAPAPAERPAPTSSERSAPAPAASRSVTIDLPPPTPSALLPETSVTPLGDLTAADSGPTFLPASDTATPGGGTDGAPTLPWLLALLAAAGGAAFYFLRMRPRAQFAGAAGVTEFRGAAQPEPEPRPVPRPAPPAPAPAKPALPTGGIVSTRLRPWIEIEFTPERAIVADDQVSVEFVVSIFNSGSAPARDILVEASLFNAGPLQDKRIKMFFDNPVGQGDRIPALPPLQRLAFRSTVQIPRAQLRPIEIEGRPLLVPLVVFNVLYRFGSGSDGQTSTSYLVGKETKGDKLAPFRLDLGPRIFRGLAAREHELRVRN